MIEMASFTNVLEVVENRDKTLQGSDAILLYNVMVGFGGVFAESLDFDFQEYI